MAKIWLSIERNNQLLFSRSSINFIKCFASQVPFDVEDKKMESSLESLNKKQGFVFDSLLYSLKQYGLDEIFEEIRQKAKDIDESFKQKYIEFEKCVIEKKSALVLAELQSLSAEVEQKKVEMKKLEEELDERREPLKLSDDHASIPASQKIELTSIDEKNGKGVRSAFAPSIHRSITM